MSARKDEQLTSGELALLRGQARAKERWSGAHKAMHAAVKKETETAVALLHELRVQHLAAGHFENGSYREGVGEQAVELALMPDAARKAK